MADFILEISENNRHLCVQRGSFVVQEGKKVLGQVPIDSVNSVILSADGISLSKHFLVRAAEERIPVVICDKKYLPISIALPYGTHYKSLPVTLAQMNASPVLKKQLWQRIVTAKIHNQAAILSQCHPQHPTVEQLTQLASKVFSGDKDNKEAQAARAYWPALLGDNFLRDQDGEGFNIFLNYGYTIVRSACARALCGAGLLPLLGLYHHNAYNAFCLADDIMEPLRPFVDKLVFSCQDAHECTELEPKHKKILAHILHSPLPFAGEEHSLASIAKLMAQGLSKSFQDDNPTLLTLPYAMLAI